MIKLFNKIKPFSRVIQPANSNKSLRNYTTRRDTTGLPQSRGNPKISAFGKFLFVKYFIENVKMY